MTTSNRDCHGEKNTYDKRDLSLLRETVQVFLKISGLQTFINFIAISIKNYCNYEAKRSDQSNYKTIKGNYQIIKGNEIYAYFSSLCSWKNKITFKKSKLKALVNEESN